MLLDTHAHLNFNGYKENFEEVIKRTLENDVWMINVGSQYETSKKAVEIAERYEKGVYAAVGLHPIHLAEGIFKVKMDKEETVFQTKNENFDYEKYKGLTQSKKVVAIGETGLDYYYRPKTKIRLEQFKNKQKEVFLKHLELAMELKLPVIFHCRMAHQDLIEVLNSKFKIQNSKITGVIHCFTGTWEQAGQYLEMGLYLGFNGIIFKPAPYRTDGSGAGLNLDEIIKKTPLERILIETDCPYLVPPPMSGRNEPLYVKYVAEKIAKIKNLSFEEISEITTGNAKKLFNL